MCKRWEISDLYEKFPSIESKKYIIIFNYSKIWNRVKGIYEIDNNWIWRDFIEGLYDLMIEKLILHINFEDKYEGNW